MMKFGDYIKKRRKTILHEFCIEHGFSSYVYEALEKNEIPPQTYFLKSIAQALKISQQSHEWVRYNNLAQLSMMLNYEQSDCDMASCR